MQGPQPTAAPPAARTVVATRMRRLVRRRTERTALGTHLGGHQALRSGSEADQNELSGAQFGDSEPAQGLHMDKDVGRPLPARQEAETAKSVEPFHLRPFETACGRYGH